jgi:lactoylglutathione lyase
VSRARALGLNHVALEVGDLEAALAFYGEVFEVRLRGRAPGMAFIDLGDQFIALSEGREGPPDAHRHVGLVVDDLDAVRAGLARAGAEPLPGRGLDFRDPWGNRIQVVAYRDVQFLKDARVLAAMGAPDPGKTPAAVEELRRKGVGLL